MIICDHVGYFGFDYGIVAMIEDARKRFLKPGGVVVPRELRLMIAGAQSEQCRKKANGWALDPVPPEYHWLREFAVNTKHRVVFEPADICCDVVELGTIALDRDVEQALSFECVLTASHSGTFDGLACWFACLLGEETWMTNSPLAPESIGRSQAFLPAREAFAVAKGDRIAVKVQIRHADGTITWTITPPNGKRQRLSSWNSQILRPEDLRHNTAVPLTLSHTGRAYHTILDLVDGVRSLDTIEALALAVNPPLFPSDAETIAVVRQVLGKHTTCQ